MCFVEISKALPTENKINKRYYQHIDTTIDNRTIFRDLGRHSHNCKTVSPPTLERWILLWHADMEIFKWETSSMIHILTLLIHLPLLTWVLLQNINRLILDPLYFIYFFSNIFLAGVSNQEHFIEKLKKDETFKSKISNMITSFITGYVSNLNPNIAKQMNKTIQEKANLTDLFYSGWQILVWKRREI